VWQVSWAHPMYGNYLASCSYDGKVIVWKEMSNNKWSAVYEYSGHESSVNSVQWAPCEFGLSFACASSDGSISIVSLAGDGQWEHRKIDNAHPGGCNSISWSPAFPHDEMGTSSKRLVSGGCDESVKLWHEESNHSWTLEQTLSGHNDWIRDVAWSQNIIHSKTSIASCSQSGKVIIWTCDLNDSLTQWKQTFTHEFNTVVWHVSWSLTSNMLAISGGDNKVTIWKEDNYGKYVCINDNSLNSASDRQLDR
jgi:protein transport protein SEC13